MHLKVCVVAFRCTGTSLNVFFDAPQGFKALGQILSMHPTIHVSYQGFFDVPSAPGLPSGWFRCTYLSLQGSQRKVDVLQDLECIDPMEHGD